MVATAFNQAPTPEAFVVCPPGENTPSPVLLDEAVDHLNRIYVAKGLEAAREIGEYVLRAFFDGDLKAFHAKGRKQMSFRRLAGRQDLLPSYSHIYNCVAVVEQLRQLPKDIGEALSVSHHKALFTVRNPGDKRALADRAVEQKMTVRALRKAVAESLHESGQRSKAGRPPLPSCVKGFRKVIRAIETIDEPTTGEPLFAHFTLEESRDLLAELDDKLEQLASARRAMQERIEAAESGRVGVITR